jgi:hypothetical protein
MQLSRLHLQELLRNRVCVVVPSFSLSASWPLHSQALVDFVGLCGAWRLNSIQNVNGDVSCTIKADGLA